MMYDDQAKGECSQSVVALSCLYSISGANLHNILLATPDNS